MIQQDGTNKFPKKVLVFSSLGLLVSLGVLANTLTTVILMRSFWYMLLVIYYTMLVVMRFSVLHLVRRNIRYPYHDKYETFLNIYTAYGIIFISLTAFFALTFFSDFQIHQSYKMGIPLTIFAGFAIIKFFVALYNFHRARQSFNIFVRILRNLSLIDGLMTFGIMLILSSTYILGGDMQTVWLHSIIEMSIGAVISLVATVLGICMIVEASKQRKQLKSMQIKERSLEEDFINSLKK